MASLVRLFAEGGQAGAATAAPVRLSRADLGLVCAIVAISVGASLLMALLLVGPIAEAVIPALVIPFAVSLPVSLYLVRQRARIERLNRQLEELLRRDALTGVLTRRYFLARLAEAMPRGGVLLMIDLDAFKAVNDTWGHAAGDAVLTEVAGRIGMAAGPEVLFGRLGGEEFALFAAGLDGAGGAALGEALRRAVAERPVRHGATAIACSISQGLAVVPPGGAMLEDVLHAADLALYAAKAAGRDRLHMARPVAAGA